MKNKRLLLLMIILFGETLIILCFLHFGKKIQSEILSLNIAVSTIIYSLFLIDFIIPWVDLNDKAQKNIGLLGPRWFFTAFYMLFAVVSMVMFNTINPIDFFSQVIIQSVLIFLLLLGFLFSFYSSDQVSKTFTEEIQNRAGIEEMKKHTNEVYLKLQRMQNIPSDILAELNNLQSGLRFISPSNNSVEQQIENKYIDEIKNLSNYFSVEPLNWEKINNGIKDCKCTLHERKQVFSK